MEPRELLAQGMEFAQQGDHDRAREFIAKAVKADPSLKQGWWALAHLVGNKDQQLYCLKQVLKLDPTSKQARAKLETLQSSPQSTESSDQTPAVSQAPSSSRSPQSIPPSSEQGQPESPHRRKRQRSIPGTARSKKIFYIAAAVVGIILVGALLTWLVASGALQGLFGEGGDELGNLPVPTLPLAWTPTPELMILVPTFSPTPSATQREVTNVPAQATQHTPTPTPTLRFTLTPTPTYNPRIVPTMTQAAPAACPLAASPGTLNLTEPFEDFYAAADEVLAYLNAGGSITEVRRALGELQWGTELILQDLTNDGIDEIVLYVVPIYVFGCRDGQYVELMQVQPEVSDPYFGNVKIYTQDLNLNGVSDLLYQSEYSGSRNSTLNIEVYEWNGEDFETLIPEEIHHPYYSMGYIMFVPNAQISMLNGHLRLEDIDRNGTIEIILRGGVEYGYIGQLSAPQPVEIHTWMWNGEEFNFFDVAFSPPTLKIHAVQAGDVAAQLEKYEQALELYWQAIEDPSLEAWNVERNEWMPEWTDPGTPTPTHPPPDPDQGDRVEAYARFRIVVTNLLLGRNDEAEAQYQNLLDLHPAGDPGNLFAQMATAFWEAYQTTSQVANGCAAAREFVDQDAGEILGSLGWATYGEANKSYGPEDICPFQ